MNINTVNYWNAKHIDEYYQRFISPYERMYHDFIFERLSDGKKLIDIGCGSGIFIEDLIKRGRDLIIHGIDFSDAVIKLNKEYFKKYDKTCQIFTVNNLMKIKTDFKESSFDYVTCMETVEHVDDYEKLISDLGYLCKPNGKVFITIPNNREIIVPEHVNYFNSQVFMNIIKKYGKNIDYSRIRNMNGKGIRNLAYAYRPIKSGGIK